MSVAVEIASFVARNNGCSLEGRELELIVLTNSTYPNGVYQATVKGSRLTNVRVPLPPVRLPEDRVDQLGRIITARVSGLDLQNTIDRARNLTENRARQSGFSETPRVDVQFEQTKDSSGRTIYNVVFAADYIIRGQ
jgi:hypothetical protein